MLENSNPLALFLVVIFLIAVVAEYTSKIISYYEVKEERAIIDEDLVAVWITTRNGEETFYEYRKSGKRVEYEDVMVGGGLTIKKIKR